MGKMGRFFKAIGQGIGMGASWLSTKLADFQILILSAVIVLAYLLLLYIGVADQNRLLIIFCGIITSLYFCIIVFLALERPSLFGGLIARLGLILQNGKWSAKDKKRVQCLWFFAAAPLFFVFWLAMFPTKTMGFLAIVVALCLLTLLIIGHWQKIPTSFWKAYYNFGKKAFPITIIIVFLIYAPFASFWNGIGKLIMVKSQQAAAWMSAPSKTAKAEKRVVKTRNNRVVQKKTSIAAASQSKAERTDAPSATLNRISSSPGHGPSKCQDTVSSDDDLAEAAKAGLSAFDQMRKELAELHAQKRPRKSQPAVAIKTPWWAK